MPQAVTPAYDNKIYQKYSKKMIQNKEKNKIAFCEDFGLRYDKRVPLICITYPLTEKNEVEILQQAMRGLLEQDVQLTLMGIGTEKYQSYFTKLAEEHEDRVSIVEESDENRRKVYAASDMVLLAGDSDECCDEASKAMKYGVVPISPRCDFLENYDGSQERGNAFIYTQKSPWGLFASVIRAIENFRFPYDWRNIRLAAMDGEEGEDEE